MSDVGNEAQVRIIAEQIADVAITRFASSYSGTSRQQSPTIELPAPFKWAALVITAVFTVGATTGLIGLVTTVNELQVTLGKIDQRMISERENASGRYTDLERRVDALERETPR